jgi:hypothetical protein
MSEDAHGSDIHAKSAKTRSWLTGKWSPLCRIIENTPGKRWSDMCRPDGPGVYRLVALDANEQGFAPAPLNRVCGIDPTGTLYIGKTTSLRKRLRTLVLTNDPNIPFGGGHAFMSAKPQRRFPFQLRAVTWQRTSEVWNAEKKLFENYTTRFGELPPMNLNG